MEEANLNVNKEKDNKNEKIIMKSFPKNLLQRFKKKKSE